LRIVGDSLELCPRSGRVVKRFGQRRNGLLFCALSLGFLPLAGLAGCSHFQPKPAPQYVYVTAKDTYLRDRVAAVSNRVGQVQNGEKLLVLDHARHWLKVQTGTGKLGWIEEREVATQAVGEAFEKLAAEHKKDPQVASGVTRDVVYLHLKPGRETEHFYLLPESDKLKVLRRATLVKPGVPVLTARAQRPIPQVPGAKPALKTQSPGKPGANTYEAKAQDAVPPVYEDWWLVRDTAGHTGWLFGRMMDVDAPDALTRYAEGQRIVGAYVLTTVYDAEAPFPDKNVPIYVTVLGPYTSGLPYDFNQVRVYLVGRQAPLRDRISRQKYRGLPARLVIQAERSLRQSGQRTAGDAGLQLQGAAGGCACGDPEFSDWCDDCGTNDYEDISPGRELCTPDRRAWFQARRRGAPCRRNKERESEAQTAIDSSVGERAERDAGMPRNGRVVSESGCVEGADGLDHRLLLIIAQFGEDGQG